MEFTPQMGQVWAPLTGTRPYNKKNVEAAEETTEMLVNNFFEKHLAANTWFVGDRLSLADILCATLVARGFQYIYGTAWREAHPHTSRWFTTVVNQPIYLDTCGEAIFCTEPVKYTPPKKEEKKKETAPAPKKEAPKKEVKEVDEEEDEKPAPKPKHPLEALGPASLVLDSWKRQYSNEDTRPVALPWFWDHYKPEEYSLFKVKYKVYTMVLTK